MRVTDPKEETRLRRFAELLDRCERMRPSGLPLEELRELAGLSRAAAARLARLRDRDDDPEAIRYLNALCVRAHGHLNVLPRAGEHAPPPLLSRIPDALARTWRAQLLAWALLAIGIYVGAGLVARDSRAAYALVPTFLGYGPSSLDRLIESAEARSEFLIREQTPLVRNAFFGSFLFANNTRVGLLSFATGIFAGIPTVLLAVFNGITVGALSAVFFRDPLPIAFLAWILPHGIPELTAITLCVTAGLMLGGAVAMPGRRGRKQALQEAAESALLLFVASLPLFLLAAAIESFVRESALGTTPRLALATAMLAGVVIAAEAIRRLSRRRTIDLGWIEAFGEGGQAPVGSRGG